MKRYKKEFLQETAIRLRKVRKHLRFTRTQMAERFGLGPNAYRKMESGESFFSGQTLERLFFDYNISMDWLLFNKGTMFRQDLEQVEPMRQQLTVNKERLEELEKETAGLPPLTEDIKQMLIRMDKNPKIYHEIMLTFHRVNEEKVESKE